MAENLETFELVLGKIKTDYGFQFSDGTITGSGWTCRVSWLKEISRKWGFKCFNEDYNKDALSQFFGRPEKIIEHRELWTLLFWQYLLKQT